MWHDRARLAFDTSCPKNIEHSLSDWTDLYKEVVEQIPKDGPESLGKSIEMTAYLDCDNTGDKVTRRSHTGVLIFFN